MSTKAHRLQNMMRWYREETGESEIDHHDVAAWAHKKGMPFPKQPSPLDLLAKEFSKAAREEIRHDATSGKPYRANHALVFMQGDKQMALWVDIDEAPRLPMLKRLVQRREQMVGDGLQLSFDMDHWNSIHPDEEPIALPLDLTPDVEWRKNAPDDDEVDEAS